MKKYIKQFYNKIYVRKSFSSAKRVLYIFEVSYVRLGIIIEISVVR